MRTVFVNPERCIGCLQCELACAVEHSASQDETVAFLEVPVPRKRVHVGAGPVATFAFPNRCRHCDPAPCLQVCPTGAITRDDGHALVLVEPRRCIGCAMCAVVCPFDVLTFHPVADGPGPGVAVAVKCDGCIERLRRGETPACAEVCKVDALVFGDLNELVAAGRLRGTGAVLAAGDVAEAADRFTGERFVHAIFVNAVAQAPIAAANLLGADLRYDGAEAMNSLKHLGVPIVSIGTTDAPDEILRRQEGGDVRTVYLRDDTVIGAQLAGDIRAAGVYRSLMLRRDPVTRYGRSLVEPGSGMADIAFDALGHGPRSLSVV